MACIEKRTITIKAVPNAAGGIDFSMFENGQPVVKDTIISAKDKLKNHKMSDYHTFTFELENAQGSNLKFVDNPFDVMWVKPGNETNAGPCPEKRSTDPDFCVAETTNNRLVVHNANGRKCKHKFALNFVDTKPDGSQVIVPYDPVWTNSNGGNR